MSKPPVDKPVKPGAGKPGRLAREAAALRANLGKRKEQMRQRSEAAKTKPVDCPR